MEESCRIWVRWLGGGLWRGDETSWLSIDYARWTSRVGWGWLGRKWGFEGVGGGAVYRPGFRSRGSGPS